MNIVTAYIITFIASFCILVIEIVAGRILAPFVGVSLYTWTSIIGVVLAGISIGAYLGGKLADRFPGRKTLGWLLLVSGIATLLILSFNKYCCRLSFTHGHSTTFRPWLAQSCTTLSSQSRSNRPSSGSMKAQANSPMCTNSRPIFLMFAMSLAHWSSGQASG